MMPQLKVMEAQPGDLNLSPWNHACPGAIEDYSGVLEAYLIA
jgi:hypothetical protein